MIHFDDPLAVGQDVLLALDDAVGRQAPLGLAQGHAAPTGMEADAQLASGADLVVQRNVVGEEVQVIGGSGAARENQLGQAHQRADVDGLPSELRPDWIKPAQPIEKLHVLDGGQGAGQGLIEVVMGVHQPWQHDHP